MSKRSLFMCHGFIAGMISYVFHLSQVHTWRMCLRLLSAGGVTVVCVKCVGVIHVKYVCTTGLIYNMYGVWIPPPILVLQLLYSTVASPYIKRGTILFI